MPGRFAAHPTEEISAARVQGQADLSTRDGAEHKAQGIGIRELRATR